MTETIVAAWLVSGWVCAWLLFADQWRDMDWLGRALTGALGLLVGAVAGPLGIVWPIIVWHEKRKRRRGA